MDITMIKEAVYDAVAKAKKRGITAKQLEIGLDICNAYVNQLINRKADGMGKARWVKLYNNPMLGIVNNELIETPNFRQITQMAKDCIEFGEKKLVYGRTGFGKTTVLKHIINSGVLSPNSFYILCDIMMNQKAFVLAIANAMGITTERKVKKKLKLRSTKELFNEIIEKLSSLNEVLLLFDDAGKLSAACHRLIQLIEDKTGGMIGILVACTDQYYEDRLQKMANDEVKSWIGFPEYWGRFTFFQRLHGPSESDVYKMCQNKGLSKEYHSEVMKKIIEMYGDKEMKKPSTNVMSDAQYKKAIEKAKWSYNPANNEVDYRQIASVIGNVKKLLNKTSKGQHANG